MNILNLSDSQDKKIALEYAIKLRNKLMEENKTDEQIIVILKDLYNNLNKQDTKKANRFLQSLGKLYNDNRKISQFICNISTE